MSNKTTDIMTDESLYDIATPFLKSLMKQINTEIDKKVRSLRSDIISGNKPFLTLNETAEYLNLSIKTIYQYIHNNKISYYKPMNGKVYFSIDELNTFILNEKAHNKSISDIERELDTEFMIDEIS